MNMPSIEEARKVLCLVEEIWQILAPLPRWRRSTVLTALIAMQLQGEPPPRRKEYFKMLEQLVEVKFAMEESANVKAN